MQVMLPDNYSRRMHMVIRGQFDVSLSVPVEVTPDFARPGLAPCLFQIHGSRVAILPLRVTDEGMALPIGDYEPARLTEIRIWVTREIAREQEEEDNLTLSPDEESIFEEVLVEATRRFVTVIKHKTNQWDLDTRHPVYAYNYEYSPGDVRSGTELPIAQGTKRIPKYVEGTINGHPGALQEELTREVWQEAADEISGPASISLHDELLSDARTLLGHVRYDVSALYAAIASELMLEKACGRLVREKQGLGGKQCEAKIGRLKVPDLLREIREMDPGSPVKEGDVLKLFQLRNRLAHGEAQAVTGLEANQALGIAEQLRRDLGFS